MTATMERVVVAIYIDPDFYPPTINAILNIASISDEVIVISRNNIMTDYPYPPNVHLKKTGKFIPVRGLEKQAVWKKVFYFLKFSFSLFRHAKKNTTGLVVLYDPLALFAFYLVKNIRRNKKIWYHNHDMPGKALLRNYSIGSLAAKNEKKAMAYIDYFSLPSIERIEYYPGIKDRKPVIIIPNYPSLKVYNNFKTRERGKKLIKIIFQGFIGAGHALEEILEVIQEDINGSSFQLILKGSVTDGYKRLLDGLAEKFNVTNKLKWIPISPYNELPALTASCHIGIGINMNTDIVSQSLGTASNKIYEYAASGLPVILFDTEQLRKYLGTYKWAFFTNGSIQSLKENIALIVQNLFELGNAARKSFEQELNFEKNFWPALQTIIR